ncbi:MAG: mRNA surveillance protein pelota [Candidatus Bathyarchaeia archaeon]
MKLLEFQEKKGISRLAVENLDDLWHLYNLIEKDDEVTARTTREVKSQAEGSRPSEGRRVPMTLTVRVSDVYFDKSSDRIRVRGLVTEGPERYDGVLGAYHTHSIEVDSTLTLRKNKWPPQHLRRLKDACHVRSQPLIIVALDDEDVCVAVIGRFRIDARLEKRVGLPGKREPDRRQTEVQRLFSEVAQVLAQAHQAVKSGIVLLGPGFLKSQFLNYLKQHNAQLASAVVRVGFVSSGGLGGVQESLRSGVLTPVVRRSRMVEEMNLVEGLFAELGAGSRKVTYGVEEVARASEMGAVDVLMVVDNYLREVEDAERERLEALIHRVEDTRGHVYIISGAHEGGEKIQSLGGVAAQLRYAL